MDRKVCKAWIVRFISKVRTGSTKQRARFYFADIR